MEDHLDGKGPTRSPRGREVRRYYTSYRTVCRGKKGRVPVEVEVPKPRLGRTLQSLSILFVFPQYSKRLPYTRNPGPPSETKGRLDYVSMTLKK